MKLFLDSRVLLASSGSAKGASRLLTGEAADRGWVLVSSLDCFGETRHNLPKLRIQAVAGGIRLAWSAPILAEYRPLSRRSLCARADFIPGTST